MLKEADVIQVLFSHANKENVYENIQQYFFMSFHTTVFSMTMIKYTEEYLKTLDAPAITQTHPSSHRKPCIVKRQEASTFSKGW